MEFEIIIFLPFREKHKNWIYIVLIEASQSGDPGKLD